VLPLLVVMVCPLSMVAMMAAVGRRGSRGSATGTCHGGASRASGIADDQSTDVAALRGEIDQLRAQLRHRVVLDEDATRHDADPAPSR
jgi:hypothetical protein